MEDIKIIWQTESDLGSIHNGSVVTLSISAYTTDNNPISFKLRPGDTGILPQGVILLPDGLLSGRVSFRCHVDDPANIPVDDLYHFTVRATVTTSDEAIEFDKEFTLKVVRYYDVPYDNVWIRTFPPIPERLQFQSLLNDDYLFPPELIYRPTDPWFGKSNQLRLLFAPGLPTGDPVKYEIAMSENHYYKKVLFGEIKTAVALDSNLSILYEVVYLTIIDSMEGKDPESGNKKAESEVIDLRKSISNYYYDDKGNAYYTLKPNALDIMYARLIKEIGVSESGGLPLWMTSLQPIPNEPTKFNPPLGYVRAVVLAYTKPGGSKLMKYRLTTKNVSFNKLQFETDRYQLDNYLSSMYDVSTNTFLVGEVTTFDDDTTIFDNHGTKIVSNNEIYAIPEFHDKYLAFPKVGVFV